MRQVHSFDSLRVVQYSEPVRSDTVSEICTVWLMVMLGGWCKQPLKLSASSLQLLSRTSKYIHLFFAIFRRTKTGYVSWYVPFYTDFKIGAVRELRSKVLAIIGNDITYSRGRFCCTA